MRISFLRDRRSLRKKMRKIFTTKRKVEIEKRETKKKDEKEKNRKMRRKE